MAERLGVEGIRAAQMAVYCAHAHAAFRGSGAIGGDDIVVAVCLVFAHRMTVLPEDQPEVDRKERDDEGPGKTEDAALQERNLKAAATHLPDSLLAGLAFGGAGASVENGRGTGSGRHLDVT